MKLQFPVRSCLLTPWPAAVGAVPCWHHGAWLALSHTGAPGSNLFSGLVMIVFCASQLLLLQPYETLSGGVKDFSSGKTPHDLRGCPKLFLLEAGTEPDSNTL